MKIEQVGVTGFMGRVGSRLVALGARPIDVDVTDEFNIPKGIRVVVNCAATSSPQYCEDHPDACFAVNILGVHNLINACYPRKIGIVHITSDHVFSGYKFFGSYKENDKRWPLNNYGASKVAAEDFVASYEFGKVVRTSMLFDDPTKLCDYNAERLSILIKRTFMHLDTFANCLKYFVENFDDMPEVLHISGTEKISWHSFMTRVRFIEQTPNNYKRKWWFTKSTCNRPINGGLDVTLAQRLGVPVETVSAGLWRWWNG